MNEVKLKSPVLEDIFILNSESLYETEIARQCFNIIDNLVYALDLNGKITLVNHRACEISEMKESELVGKEFTDLLEDNDQKQEIKAGLGRIFEEGGKKGGAQYRIKTRSGARRTIKARHVLMHNKNSEVIGVLMSGEDITDLINVQEELESKISQFRMLARSIPNINLFLFNSELHYIFAEGSEMNANGLSAGDFEGRSMYDVHEEKMSNLLSPLYKLTLTGEEISNEFLYRGQDYRAWMFPLRDQRGEIYGGMSITQNITESKQASESLKEAKFQAEQANHTKSEFLANMSHEIRTPLNAIVGFTEQLLKTSLNDEQEKYAKIIDKASEHLLLLVNDILVLSKIDVGKIQLENTPFRPESVLEEVYSTFKMRAKDKGLTFNWRIAKEANKVFKGDPTRLKQVLINLVSNAIKFTPSGYVEVQCYPEENEPDKLFFEVLDSGIGIPGEKFEKIFDQFSQADSTVTKKYGGTGLGLTICKKLTEAQGGEISVWSEEGVGSRFSFYLPLSPVNDDELPVESDIKSQKFEDMALNLKVLLVDDDSVNCLLGKTVLENLNCTVDLAWDGTEALEKIRQDDYDILLLDIHMPELSGIDVARIIRNEMKIEKMPIIAVTAAVLGQDLGSFKDVGINDYLIKPFKEIALFNKLTQYKNVNLTEMNDNQIDTSAKNKNLTINLSNLESIVKGDKKLIVNMLKTFKQNVVEGREMIKKYAEKEDWKEMGEWVHKLLPSFRHLEIAGMVKLMEEIKIKSLVKNDYRQLDSLHRSLQNGFETILDEVDTKINETGT